MRRSLAVVSLTAAIGLIGGPALAQPAETPPPPGVGAPATGMSTLEDPVIQPFGTTCIQNCTGYVAANIESKSSQQSFTFRANFISAGGVQNPRQQVRMLGFQGQVIDEQNQYGGGRQYSGEFRMGRSYLTPVASACNTLWEGGVQLGTACTGV